MKSNSVKGRARNAARERLLKLRGSSIFRDTYQDYTLLPQNNLIPGIDEADFWGDLTKAAGNELVDDSKSPAKFCAAYSSSALAVNAFGPFRHKPENLCLMGCTGFQATQFEKPLATGTGKRPAWPDFYACGTDMTFCVESKFLEPLDSKKAEFADIYKQVVERLADPYWAKVYESLKQNQKHYQFLDAAQLVKHYLGMCNSFSQSGKPLSLLYVYWEPANAADFPSYRQHRKEVLHFSAGVNNSQVKFAAYSYEELWDEWSIQSDWGGMAQHISHLRERYSFTI